MAKRTFTYAEAVALMPEVRRLTEAAHGQVEALRAEAETAGRTEEAQSERIVLDWARAMEALGLEVKGAWLVDFDSGAGYFCWHYPEPGLHFFHTYEAGFPGRVPLQ